MFLQSKHAPVYELKSWAIIPMLLLSLLFLFGYWKIYKYGMDRMKQFIAGKEKQYNISIVYSRYGMNIRGRISGYNALVLHIQLFLGYFLAYFLPLIIIGCIGMLIPDSWMAPFLKVTPQP